MTLALPAHLVDTVSSATASGVEAAGHLLQEVGHAVSSAADTTSSRARKLARAARRGGRRSPARGNLLLVAVLVGVAVLAAVFGRSKLGNRQAAREDGNPSPFLTSETNGTTASHRAEEAKGRVKQAAGSLTGNGTLERDGAKDKVTAKAKDGVEKVRDKVEESIDTVKERLNKH